MTEPGKLADYIADNIIRDYHKKQEILENTDEIDRLDSVIEMLSYENELLMIEEKITEKTKIGMDDNQKEYYLRERMKAIREELGESEDPDVEAYDYRKKINSLMTTDENKERLLKEVAKLEKMMSGSAEATVIRNYLDTCIELPWGVYTKEKTDIKKMNAHLEKNHYGLKKVKEKILEALAVRKLNPDINGQILCLVGPPGVAQKSYPFHAVTS